MISRGVKERQTFNALQGYQRKQQLTDEIEQVLDGSGVDTVSAMAVC